MARLGTLLRDPDSFFATVRGTPSPAGPVAVAAALGATVLVRLLALVWVLGDAIEQFESAELVYAVGGQAVGAPRDLAFGALLASLLFLLGWALATAVIYLVSLRFGAAGSFRDLFALVGWGQVPSLLPAALSTAYILFVAAGAPTLTTQAAAEAWMESQLGGSAFLRALEYAAPVFALWTGYLWLLAAEHGRDLTRRQALVCVALPAGALLFNSLGSYAALLF